MRNLVTCLVLAGCGAEVDEPSPEELLAGKWYLDTPDQFDCVVGLYLGEDGNYERDLICGLKGGGVGVQATAGTWSLPGADSYIAMLPTHSSCPGDVRPRVAAQLRYELVTDDHLRLASAEGLVVLERLDEGADPMNFVATYGCFDEQRFFTPSPVRALP